MNKFEPTGFLLAVFARRRPELFLELVEKWDSVLNPVMSAISEMVYFPSFISSAARFSL